MGGACGAYGLRAVIPALRLADLGAGVGEHRGAHSGGCVEQELEADGSADRVAGVGEGAVALAAVGEDPVDAGASTPAARSAMEKGGGGGGAVAVARELPADDMEAVRERARAVAAQSVVTEVPRGRAERPGSVCSGVSGQLDGGDPRRVFTGPSRFRGARGEGGVDEGRRVAPR